MSTFAELLDTVAAFRANGITPMALGAKDGWPEAITPEDLAVLVRDWVRPEREAERRAIRAAAAETARQHWTWRTVLENLLAIVRAERERRSVVR